MDSCHIATDGEAAPRCGASAARCPPLGKPPGFGPILVARDVRNRPHAPTGGRTSTRGMDWPAGIRVARRPALPQEQGGLGPTACRGPAPLRGEAGSRLRASRGIAGPDLAERGAALAACEPGPWGACLITSGLCDASACFSGLMDVRGRCCMRSSSRERMRYIAFISEGGSATRHGDGGGGCVSCDFWWWRRWQQQRRCRQWQRPQPWLGRVEF